MTRRDGSAMAPVDTAPRHRAFDAGSSARVIAIRVRQLGDVLATLGTLRAIKSAYPQTHISFVADRHFHRLLAHAAYIDELVAQPPMFRIGDAGREYVRYVEHLRNARPDVVLDFHANTRSAVLSLMSGAAVRVGFDVRIRKWAYTDVEPRARYREGVIVPRNSHEAALDLARRAGFRDITGDSELTLTIGRESLDNGRRALESLGLRAGVCVGLNPGNPYQAKAWPEAHFIELASELQAAGHDVVLMWGPGELERVRRIAAAAGVAVAPDLQLDAITGFLKQLRAVVSIDSGLTHLAVAVGVPTVTLFGPTSTDEWHLGGAGHAALGGDYHCSPCRLLVCPYGEPPCMSEIEPRHVMQALEHLGRGKKEAVVS